MKDALLYEMDPENPDELVTTAVVISAEFTDEDAITIWATRAGDEGRANPGLRLSAIAAIRFGEQLIELGREAAHTVEALQS